MQSTAVRIYDIEEGTVHDGTFNYSIRVVCRSTGKMVEEFRRPTMFEAQQAFELAGYKPVHSITGKETIIFLR